MAEPSGNRMITLAEVNTHNTLKDMWVVLNGRVYDVTKFVDDHPGGSEVLLDVAGRDGTSGFDDVGHSIDARNMLKQYFIGDLEGGDRSATTGRKRANDDSAGLSSLGSVVGYMALFAVVIAAAYYFASGSSAAPASSR
eukprot:c27731_g1_i1.p1 GENE.c27731_g1_i1~~c27731_g1_i1.p1  ORF type:complete len:148 (-),score=32.84 c27731_g1_i1:20-436(-)